MNPLLQRLIYLSPVFLISVLSQAQTTNVYTSATSWTVPATVTTISIKVYGGAGGLGGQDCGNGCTNATAGPVGYVVATFTVVPGNVVGIYPGGKGANGSNNVTGTGGGAGGADSYPSANYNGGNGGNAGSTGSSGGGGGGGAASIVTIGGTIKIVAAGAGGGGGMANVANSGLPGSSSTSSNGTTTGGNGTTPGGDGGGGGGGGGGSNASAGGTVYATGGESAGNGGFLGGNSISGATATATNGNIAWTNGGRIEITFTSTLPVTWLSFTGTKQNNGVKLNWSTASEQNTKDYTVQHSVDGSNWTDIGIIQAAGNSTIVRQYDFIDRNPKNGVNFYRLLQQDIDHRISYSKVIIIDLSAAEGKLKIYPNPVSNGMMTANLKEATSVRIYNSIGMKVMQKELQAGSHLLDLSKLAKGVYCIKANGEQVLFIIQ